MLVLELNTIAYDHLVGMHQTGLFGRNLHTTAEMILCEHLRKLVIQQ